MLSSQKSLFIILTVLLFVRISPGQEIPDFDQAGAFHFLEKQCAFGPRNPGSEGYKKCLQYLVEELKRNADQVQEQPFLATLPGSGKAITLTNIIATYGQAEPAIMFCAHWDTRPWADSDPNPANRSRPISGANDGASGVAILLELSRILKKNPPPRKVMLVLFDGEDSGLHNQNDTWCLGSRYFAQHFQALSYPEYAVLIDLVGDRDLHIPKEGYSEKYVGDLVTEIWNTAHKLGLSAFDDRTMYYVIDDHLELLKVGIRAIDIIDFDYPYWHTLNDTPDKCSAESLDVIGTLLLHLIYESN